jgi:hypothetical protein
MHPYRGILVAVCFSTLAACSVETTSAPPPPPAATTQGEAVVDWTIDGVKDPNKCAQATVATIEITVFDANGGHVGNFQQSCSAFATSIALAPGSYSANATLLDPGGAARTTSIAIQPFRILGNDTLNLPIDFPASSFFGAT